MEFAEPVPATRHRVRARWHGVTTPTLITIYLALLILLPSNLAISGLGSLGQPALLWGVALFGWWVFLRVQAREQRLLAAAQPVRFFLVALLVIALVSFAVAMMRGQPSDQVSPAITALIRLVSWLGVALAILDGIRTMSDLVTLVRRIGVFTALIAALGIAQFVTRSTLLDVFRMLPGFTLGEAWVADRGGVARVPGTAIHALEYATVLNAALPLVIALAVTQGFRARSWAGRHLWWVAVVLIALAAILGVSRSATVGFAVACATMLPALPGRYRLAVTAGFVFLAAAAVVVVPGLYRTTLQLFVGAGTDPSTQSRTGALERAPEFIGESPLVGVGFGTFLPRYYIVDNQWVLIAVELGLVGLMVFLSLLLAAVWSAVSSRKRSADADTRTLGYALAAAVVNVGVLFAFFDGMSFPMSAGMLIVLVSLCSAMRTMTVSAAPIAATEPSVRAEPRRVVRTADTPPVSASSGAITTAHERRALDDRRVDLMGESDA